MILLADVNNSYFSFALYSKEGAKAFSYRVASDSSKTMEEYLFLLSQIFMLYGMDPKSVEGEILSSVVPALTSRIQEAIETYFSKPCLLLSRRLKTGLLLKTDHPQEVGSDLIALALGAYNRYQEGAVIVHMSSVITLLAVSDKKEFLGGMILPGLSSSLKAMVESCAKIPEVEIEEPRSAIGKNTKECLSSGVLNGYSDLILSQCERLERESGTRKRMMTGFDSKILKNRLFASFDFDDDLIFEGLLSIYLKNQKGETL